MADLWAVIVGGAIGISGTLASAALAHRLEAQRLREEGRRAIRRLLGRQAAMEGSLEGQTVETLQRKYLEMVAAFEAQLKKHPALLDLTQGFLETMGDDMAKLHAEEQKLKAELDRLKSEHDRLKDEQHRLQAEIDLLRKLRNESSSAKSEGK